MSRFLLSGFLQVAFGLYARRIGRYQRSQRAEWEARASIERPSSTRDKIEYYRWTSTTRSARLWLILGNTSILV